MCRGDFEIKRLAATRSVELADLLLLFIRLEDFGLAVAYYKAHTVPVTLPVLIAIAGITRLIILQGKDSNPEILLYEAGAIVLVAIAVIILRLRYIPFLKPIEDVDEIPKEPRSKKK